MDPSTKHDITFATSDHGQLDRPYVFPAGAPPCQHPPLVEVPGEHFARHDSCPWGKNHGLALFDGVKRWNGHAMIDISDSYAASQTRNGEELHHASTPRHVHRLYPFGHGPDEHVRVRRRDGRKTKVIDGGQGVWDIIADWAGGFMTFMLDTIPI
ncbi:hypothetical protein OHC33_011249 [Knufia fluminis]|uniref:Uncharacterized protein n=1 Tax=Knufia fluminis TaxID=191047 RepID=A0AAN8E881_9EURO|nr:hypothetical protein OHC33_011249 [Knufia fluminis]